MPTDAPLTVPGVTPVDPTVFASLDPPLLAGSRCPDCGTLSFPAARSCPRCMRSSVEPVELPDRGTVWTWTVQGFPPKPPYVPPPGGFVPFPVGYVDLGGVLVEGRLVADPAGLEIGLPVHLVLEQVGEGPDGPVVTYAFAADTPGTGTEEAGA
ncbi:Zn-ribbon domain-containing OB-fold protein [Trujillonella humicola]|uniref:Zn-ribbon domain-containing OB-fold protein n=1 Tax=Trujillonella humicola TaxID=3383699 RepID=UPI00390592F2